MAEESTQTTGKMVSKVPKSKGVKKKRGQKPRLHSGKNIIPSETIAGSALIFVIAIMTFLACLTLGGVSMISQSAGQWQSDISHEVTIQIKPSDDRQMDEAIRAASKIALSFDGVSKVTALNDAATARLLEPWLGSGLDINQLPVPRLLTVTIADGERPDFDALRKRLAAEVLGSSLDDHRAWSGRLTTMALTMVTIGISVFILVLAATVTTVIFATRGAMAGNKDVVEVLHFVGADGAFVSRQFQLHFLILGLKGAFAGALAAVSLFVMLSFWSSYQIATPEGDQITALFGMFSPNFWGYLGMILVLFLVAGLTAVTSRWAVHQQIRILQDYNRGA
ncbi:MAG: ABC transporter permease [Pseudomonadota bacterium]